MHEEIFPPPYADLDAANKEIRRLQKVALLANEKVSSIAGKRAQDQRAARGSLKGVQDELQEKSLRVVALVEAALAAKLLLEDVAAGKALKTEAHAELMERYKELGL